MPTQEIVENITPKTQKELKNNEWNDIENQNEYWKTIDGYPRFQCSNTGKIRHWTKNKWILSKFRITCFGYFLVNLYDDKIKKDKSYSAHRVIALNLIPNPNNYPVINHVDGNKQNNNISNLEWCSHKHNSQHAFRLGLKKDISGENNYGAKLTFNIVNKIREKYLTGEYTYLDLSKIYSMAFVSIKRIIRNQSWFDVRFDNEEYYEKIKQLRKDNKKVALQKIRRKISDKDIKQIRILYFKENISITDLGKTFGINKSNVSQIIKNKIWVDKNYTFSQEEMNKKIKENFIINNNMITKEILVQINNLYSDGLTQKEIGDIVGFSQARIGEILRGENLKTIKI